MNPFGPNSRSGLKPYVVSIPIALIAGLSFGATDFLNRGNLSNLSAQIAPLAIATLGQLLVALVGGIDLSIGSVISLTTCVVSASAGSTAGIALALLLGCVVGIANGVAVSVARMHPIIATLSSMTFVQGLALYWLPTGGGLAPPFLPAFVNSTVAGLSVSSLLLLGCLIVVAWLLVRTRFGLRLYAVGAHPRNASLNGVTDRQITVAVYAACGLLAAGAGIVLTGRIGSGDPIIGAQFALATITAVALGGVQFSGGVGSAVGAFCGVLTLGLMRNGMNLVGVDAFLQSAATGVLLLIAISFQRRKIIGF
ncbi:MAG: ABC transporter permease [Paraburkholderia sp.]|uniref:ABC transporter permease n=1 Tax=Paraburkholderia sp. TaxID=1926495 RepID=UPI003977E971